MRKYAKRVILTLAIGLLVVIGVNGQSNSLRLPEATGKNAQGLWVTKGDRYVTMQVSETGGPALVFGNSRTSKTLLSLSLDIDTPVLGFRDRFGNERVIDLEKLADLIDRR